MPMPLPDIVPRIHWLIASIDLGKAADASIREGLSQPLSLIYLSVGAVFPSLPPPLCFLYCCLDCFLRPSLYLL